ncbi:MAG: class I SAM-dependent methyltransferase [Armatimonadetes bacterium]|nr:class I SAM-dependent methyltransferase [Armatimonadota bacterium]
MIANTNTDTDVDTALRRFLDLREEEYRSLSTSLAREELEVFDSYYPKSLYLPPSGASGDRFRLRFARGYLRYIASELIRDRDRKPYVFDAGSGLGTESLLFATLGARVFSVDLKRERRKVAEKRRTFYEQALDIQLDIEFRTDSVFNIPREPQFDYVWSNQSISHIDPAEDFVEMARDVLLPGGQLVVSDSNGNLLGRLALLRRRGLKVHKTFKMGDTGEEVPYADERTFSFGQIQELLRKSGLDVVHAECMGFLRGRTGEWVFRHLVQRLDRMPVLATNLGRLYVVAGRKPSES